MSNVVSNIIPVGWERATLGTLINVLTDYTANGSFEALRLNVTYYNEKNYSALVRTTDLEKKEFVPARFTDKKGHRFQKKTALYGGEIVLANVGSVGKVYRVPEYKEPMTLAPNTYLVKFSNKYDEEFIFQFLKSEFYLQALFKNVSSTTLAAINKDSFRSIEIDIPKKRAEQQKIAKILSSVDNLIEKTQSLIDKYSAVKQGMMADLFTRGIDLTPGDKYGQLRPSVTEAPELYQQTQLGWVPKEWNVVQFGDVINVIDPNPSHRYPEPSNVGIPLCSTESFYGEDLFVIKKPKLIPEETYQEQNLRCQFSESDVIFARKGRIGLARRYGSEKKAFSHTVVVMKPATKVVNKYWLLWVSRSYGFLHFIDKTMNTNLGVPTLGVDFIKKVPIVCPSTEEQNLISERLDNLTVLINTQITELKKLQFQKKGLTQDLLTGKVRVN